MKRRIDERSAGVSKVARPVLAILLTVVFAQPAVSASPDPAAPDGRSEKQVRADSSPISPGFWAWANERPSPGQIDEECRKGFALQFDDGNYFGVRFDASDRPVINEVGHCGYDMRAGIERCDLTTNNDGIVRRGRTESTFYPETTLRMHVRETEVGADGEESVNEYDIFPVRCPDDAIWEALNELKAAPGP